MEGTSWVMTMVLMEGRGAGTVGCVACMIMVIEGVVDAVEVDEGIWWEGGGLGV